MVLDSTVMNVSISTVVADLDTTVAAMQSAITFYTLTMAAMMLLGAKLGDVLVIPAIATLVANNYEGRDRGTAFAIIGAITGAAVAAGPLIGGFVTTYFSWRYVFLGEVVVLLVPDASAPQSIRIDLWSILLSAAGLVLKVLALLQAKTWGLVLPKQAPEIGGVPIEPLGLSRVYFMILGGLLLWVFERRQRTLETDGRASLLTPALFAIPQLRGGLTVLAAQYMVTAGLFFMIPIYLQMTLGFDALQTGLKIFPLSIALILFSAVGTRLSTVWAPRRAASCAWAWAWAS